LYARYPNESVFIIARNITHLFVSYTTT